MQRRAGHLRLLLLLAFLVTWLGAPLPAGAQSYSFELKHLEAGFDIQADGLVRVLYSFDFVNHSGYQPIDFVDVGLPAFTNPALEVMASVDGHPVDASQSDYQGDGPGIAVVLGAYAIPPGQSGQVQLAVLNVNHQFFTDDRDPQYASFEFTPTWFGEPYVVGLTDMVVSVRFPAGVQAEEPRWHAAPGGWPGEPERTLDENGQVIYTWHNPQVRATSQQVFGVSFPRRLLPQGAVVRPTLYQRLGVSQATFYTWTMCGGSLLLVVGAVGANIYRSRRRKTQYLAPRISIEGLGIKRGLTAVEAAVLLEQPLDKILTMILFGVLRKGLAQVSSRDPLDIKVNQPLPDDLQPYEKTFLKAFLVPSRVRRVYLQDVIVDLVETVEKKTSDFSRRETAAYYREIVHRAWQQVESAGTPEVQSQAFEENAEWMVMDRDYADRARSVFSSPITPPAWWQWYDPEYQSTPNRPSAHPFGAGTTFTLPAGPAAPQAGSPGLPNLPGSSFAASLVYGVQDFSANMIGNLTEFTQAVTKRTNPEVVYVPPLRSPDYVAPHYASPSIFSSGEKRSGSIWSSSSSSSSSRSSSSGSSHHSCACACAGCACACAGGGR